MRLDLHIFNRGRLLSARSDGPQAAPGLTDCIETIITVYAPTAHMSTGPDGISDRAGPGPAQAFACAIRTLPKICPASARTPPVRAGGQASGTGMAVHWTRRLTGLARCAAGRLVGRAAPAVGGH